MCEHLGLNCVLQALCSLETIEAVLLPATSRDWVHAGAMLLAHGWITPEALAQV